MKSGGFRFSAAALARGAALVLLLAPLASCGYMPDFGGKKGGGGMAGPNYRPLTSEIAALAAPLNPGAGMTVFCKAGKGSAHFAKGWQDFATADFKLAENQRSEITLSPMKPGDPMQIQGIFDRAGQKLIFCPVEGGPADKRIACTSLYALDDDLNAGIRRTFDIPKSVLGGEITCATAPEKLLPI